MLKFFDRYILKEIIPPFLIGLLVYSFVLLMNQVFLLAELFIAKGVALGIVARIFLYLIPSVLAFTVPMAVLMGILAALSRMSSD
ncbi:MAG: LptF/LptG family permease, partial [Candidatus Aminicenantes bacterium]|nr:LptF/LptG family permease [Candidatus Aminicenantes bacterium]